ncbi:MAG: protein TolR [Proteobacteria bacterium]|nr:protein TolR [Pseudomonadota bacterium]MCP4915337.1 protein TolR [Pseudomonadota bacterium]
MGMGSGGGDGGMLSEINVTPFVDVMLVLLIIFMVTAPMMVQGVEIDLPNSEAPPLTGADDQIVLGIDESGNLYINETSYDVEEMARKLKAIHEANPDAAVFVKADGSIPYQQVMDVMALAKTAGIGKVGLVTESGE